MSALPTSTAAASIAIRGRENLRLACPCPAFNSASEFPEPFFARILGTAADLSLAAAPSAALSNAGLFNSTGAMNRYPLRGSVSMNRGWSEESPSTSRSLITALFNPWSKSTNVSLGHSRSTHLRSEEHTSELQSRQYLVCRLLLEKKSSSRHDFR